MFVFLASPDLHMVNCGGETRGSLLTGIIRGWNGVDKMRTKNVKFKQKKFHCIPLLPQMYKRSCQQRESRPKEAKPNN
ncbi:predicted protein [Sclerotinia sclerotiorum 1980 UF-70]|uniref:Uncharacterized protein n=1 Tax=Sclerotinia sclerotiorum (strain ATCC 18683 / 1980 / Ss-1) TaxID=665079 RepID=A7EJI5_SCLS1|nr:predicted protein [Sclerotinia sclerotiorum 1980 UF-70]EDO03001.1 predicted protein [Sclerotinia sclerotiorum 1980 UF-70]